LLELKAGVDPIDAVVLQMLHFKKEGEDDNAGLLTVAGQWDPRCQTGDAMQDSGNWRSD